MAVLAVDIGGTKVAAALVTEQGEILTKAQQPTDLTGPEGVADQIAAMHRQFVQRPIQAVGVSVPAALEGPDTDRVIWAPNLPAGAMCLPRDDAGTA
jgi:glucokinase